MSPSLKFCTALAFVASVSAISNVQAPSSPAPNSNVTVTWSSDSSDPPSMTLALFSTDTNQTFAGGLAVANSVNSQDNQITVVFPQVIAPGSYMLSFISADNTSNILASSPAFSIGAASASASAAATSGSATATAPLSSAAASASSARSSASGALSSAASSISGAASSAASSARSVASSALSSIASGASGAASQSASTGAAPRSMQTSISSAALALVLGGLAMGAAVVG
ncbi:hypothetical protein C8R43DRAFT_597274 [Mycena crocata]|nr:hypothetical protein C8R43DRAFT_597274 [Mycena crocata]